ncbi:hypothetical protein GRI89_14735 [Altererythrobacter salegens]|uniref:PilZ domain-containing protein n=1 Tax=Croceibacterium salegens TaxID=1737568 RepID=A0A6I4T0L6_9SPHN|nr:hypothetical protein [Croceibacterium salegens]MXO60797.1 hypothetical protein [Croceibacterium salegens]
MSVLAIRAHERFGVYRRVFLRKNRTCAGVGLLIQQSLGGCRVGSLEESEFCKGDQVNFWIEGHGRIAGEVCWSGSHGVGLCFDQPLEQGDLLHLSELVRSEPEAEAQVLRLFGT